MRESCENRKEKRLKFNLLSSSSYTLCTGINGIALGPQLPAKRKANHAATNNKNLGCKTMHDYGTDYVNKEYILMIVSII